MKIFRNIAMVLMVLILTSGLAFGQYYKPYVKTIDLTVKNVPTFESGLGISTSGDEWYVNSNATGTASGTSWVNAALTIDAAINLATASNGDLINIAYTHTETYTAADGFDLDKAGLTLIFHRNGQNTANLIFGHADATVACDAANNTIYGGRFLAGITAVTAGIMIEDDCDNFTMVEPVFPEPTTSSFEFVDGIDLASGSDSVHIIGMEFYNADATGGQHAIEMGNGVNKDFQLINARIFGEFAVAAVWSNDADEEVYIAGGEFTNMTTGEFAVEFAGAATGSISNVLFRTDTQTIAVDTGSMTRGGNLLWDDEDTADSVAIPVFLGTAGETSIGQIDLTTTDSLHGKIGTDAEMADSSLYDLNVADQVDLDNLLDLREAVSVSTTAVLANGTTIFTVAGGMIKIEALVSECIATGDGGAATIQYSADPTVGAAGTFSNATGSLATAVAGSTVTVAGTAMATAALFSVTGPNLIANPGTIVIPAGIITTVVGGAASTATWKHILRYKPLEAGVTVTP